MLLPLHQPPDEGGLGGYKMASSVTHMAVTRLTALKLNLKDSDRLLLGAALPDLCADEYPNSHLKLRIRGGTKNTYDLAAFRNSYGNLMAEDCLYLGYYLHLVQDMVFRDFVYKKHHWDPFTLGNVGRLHNDYRLINSYLIEKYRLKDRIVHPALTADFNTRTEGEIFFFTKEMADDYIQVACDICVRELLAFFAGEKYIDQYERAWDTKPKSLLESAANARELGGYKTGSGGFTRHGRFIRSDAPSFLSENDAEFLENAGIRTVIDLRNDAETLKSPSPFAAMPRFDYHCVPIEEGSGIPESASAVPESYMEIAAAENIGRLFRIMAHSRNGVLFHCAAGKDRTGVVSAILLMLADVNDEEIVLDYILTKKYNYQRLEAAHLKYSNEIMNVITPKKEYMLSFMRLFSEKYGSAEGYFEEVGVLAKEVYMLKERLLGEE